MKKCIYKCHIKLTKNGVSLDRNSLVQLGFRTWQNSYMPCRRMISFAMNDSTNKREYNKRVKACQHTWYVTFLCNIYSQNYNTCGSCTSEPSK